MPVDAPSGREHYCIVKFSKMRKHCPEIIVESFRFEQNSGKKVTPCCLDLTFNIN